MKYKVFHTEYEAIVAEAAISKAKGHPRVGVNARTGLPDPAKQLTTRWAVPKQIADGRWVIPSDDGEGLEEQEFWWPPRDAD